MKPEYPDETHRLMADLDQVLPPDSDFILPVDGDPLIGAARRLAEGPIPRLSNATLDSIEAHLRARTVELQPLFNTRSGLSTGSIQLPRVLHRPDVLAQARLNRTQPTNGHRHPDLDYGYQDVARKYQDETRRMKAHGRLLTQKRKQLLSTGDVFVFFQIVLLLCGTLIERIIYDLTRWKRAFDRQPARVRGFQLIAYAALVLLIVGFIFTGEAITYVKGQRGPFLAAALASPYNLETRPVPLVDGNRSITLPASFEPYTLANSAPEKVSVSQINRCLVGLPTDYVPSENVYCTRTYGAQSLTYARYADHSNVPVDIVAASFAEEAHADQTFLELLRYTRSISQVGNFSLLDDSVVHYFYAVSTSEFHRWITFAWQRGSVIYMISALDSDAVEAAVKAFPY